MIQCRCELRTTRVNTRNYVTNTINGISRASPLVVRRSKTRGEARKPWDFGQKGAKQGGKRWKGIKTREISLIMLKPCTMAVQTSAIARQVSKRGSGTAGESYPCNGAKYFDAGSCPKNISGQNHGFYYSSRVDRSVYGDF